MNLPKKSISQRLQELPQQLGISDSSSERNELGQFLHQVVHDLNTPLGTYKMEFYSLRAIAGRLRGAVEAADTETVRRQTEIMVEILANLEEGHKSATSILAAIEYAGTQLKEV